MVNSKRIIIYENTRRINFQNVNTNNLSNSVGNLSTSDTNSPTMVTKLNNNPNLSNFNLKRLDHLSPIFDEKFSFDTYVNPNPNKTMFKLHAVPIPFSDDDNNNNNNKKNNNIDVKPNFSTNSTYDYYSNRHHYSNYDDDNNKKRNRPLSSVLSFNGNNNIVSNNNDNNDDNSSRERSKSPTMLIDLVINTPKSDIKIQRKCKSYEVS